MPGYSMAGSAYLTGGALAPRTQRTALSARRPRSRSPGNIAMVPSALM